MRKEYALEGVGFCKHWSDAYGRLGDARRAAKEIVRDCPARRLHILMRITLPQGHEIGARWQVIGIVAGGR